MTVPDHSEHYRVRDELVARLRADLLGPTGGDADSAEIITDPPMTTYAVGVLHPRTDRGTSREIAAELDHDDATATLTIDEIPDTGIAFANVRRPSAFGLTFAVDPRRSSSFVVQAEAAVYDLFDLHGNPMSQQRSERRTTQDSEERWVRRRLDLAPVTIDLKDSPRVVELHAGLELRLRIRPAPDDEPVSVTATLVNTRLVPAGALHDAFCFFQTGLRVSTGDVPALVERPARGAVDDEALVDRLLYRHAPNFATGHGCAADWTWAPPPPGVLSADPGPPAVSEVRSEFVPSHDVLLADSNPDIDVTRLGMRHLAFGADADVLASLRGLVDGYSAWLRTCEADGEELVRRHAGESEYARVIREQLAMCRTARDRMAAGIDLLERDPDAMRSFRLMNQAMATQRGRTDAIRAGLRGAAVDAAEQDGTWRPFQIGFLLLCLNGVADPDHEDRHVADLLWFPTGGGKTEAYLGLIAFAVFLRRLRHGARGGGVTVIMRYTLRLLTLQQFERAAALMCAMDILRREDPDALGTEPVSVGMWVGQAATPNDLDTARKALALLARGETPEESNPVQLRACPWCGTDLDHTHYSVDRPVRRMHIKCPGRGCSFASGLPVHVVDETVYDARPTLVIATVDKFAQVAWREQAAALFNRDHEHRGTLPPDLIVQDELHLVSGPLGTLAGLYETVVDHVADTPKVIASTATVRRAEEQCRALFNRRVAQFPPSALDARHSWFAVEAPAETKASRRYVGLLAPATSQATLLVRAYAALLHGAVGVRTTDDVRDAYWTLLGYFNSLRLLAAADLQVRDDVQDRLKLLAQRDGVDPYDRMVVTELTSRVKSSEIPAMLRALQNRLTDEDGQAQDVALATNMISVGVDVDRLGLMVVMGQPQTTAEYIQSTSRVGRRHPGLVVTLYNSMRSRDRSHYEDFVRYHSALYRQVESTSVTPFSSRARDRALHAVLVGLVRMTITQARRNSDAAKVRDFLDDVRALQAALTARAAETSPAEGAATARQLDRFVEHWIRLADENPDLVYEAPHRRRGEGPRPRETSLLRTFDESDDDLEAAFRTMWSLRDVDVESDLYLES